MLKVWPGFFLLLIVKWEKRETNWLHNGVLRTWSLWLVIPSAISAECCQLGLKGDRHGVKWWESAGLLGFHRQKMSRQCYSAVNMFSFRKREEWLTPKAIQRMAGLLWPKQACGAQAFNQLWCPWGCVSLQVRACWVSANKTSQHQVWTLLSASNSSVWNLDSALGSHEFGIFSGIRPLLYLSLLSFLFLLCVAVSQSGICHMKRITG